MNVFLGMGANWIPLPIITSLGLSLFCTSQASGDIHYSWTEDVSKPDRILTRAFRVSVNGLWFRYAAGQQIDGILGEKHEFRYESLSCRLERETMAKLIERVEAIDPFRLPEREGIAEDSGSVRGRFYCGASGLEVDRAVDSDSKAILDEIFLGFVAAQKRAHPGNIEVRVETVMGDDQPTEDVSVAALLSNPHRFKGKRIRVRGCFHQGFERSSLAETREEVNSLEYGSQVWLGGVSAFADPTEIEPRKDGFVLVEGVFQTSSTGSGHMGLWKGAIERITKFEGAKDE